MRCSPEGRSFPHQALAKDEKAAARTRKIAIEKA